MRAIDLHCHPNTAPWHRAMAPYIEALRVYWNRPWSPLEEDEFVAELRRADVKAIVVAHDSETVTGLPPCDNDYVAGLRDRHPDVIVQAWGAVDPGKGDAALAEAERAVKDLGLLGLHFHPVCGGFSVAEERLLPLWDLLQGLGAPIMVDTGFTGVGAGTPGGMGRKLKCAMPFPALDDLAADFPELTVIAAHPAWPWTDEMIAIALHKRNVFWEMSGWGPEYFPEALKRDIPRRLQDKIMFGSDYPSLTYDRLFDGWSKLGLPDDVAEKVFHQNAGRILGLG
jgi:predicted TIM-barrel fold metal-dependent hydrolase